MNLVQFLKHLHLLAALNEELIEPETEFLDLPKSINVR